MCSVRLKSIFLSWLCQFYFTFKNFQRSIFLYFFRILLWIFVERGCGYWYWIPPQIFVLLGKVGVRCIIFSANYSGFVSWRNWTVGDFLSTCLSQCFETPKLNRLGHFESKRTYLYAYLLRKAAYLSSWWGSFKFRHPV